MTFRAWLLKQSKREDSVGDLSTDLKRDIEIEKALGRKVKIADLSQLESRLSHWNACSGAFSAARQAWREFKALS